ncbi:Glycoside hydrolase, family 1 [Corchorus olitorius]|uniref:Glycoside hydrolase, family 1 n=1 Tax=Corchorus olitorius TaxID=93759 RepID=A0A1R3G031_9ROSI|nr:Glycoside hydrolase, family 1 [Corchorus olitorius]
MKNLSSFLLLSLTLFSTTGLALARNAFARNVKQWPNFNEQRFDTGGLSRDSFPEGFVFGTAASAYQVEGMASKDGRGPSIWDVFVKTPGNIAGDATGEVSVDQYHRYKEDVDLMKTLNFDAYRFSISWPRIFPNGTGKVNWQGVAYYNRLIDYMLEKGITPHANLYHYDLPLALQEKYGDEKNGKPIGPQAYSGWLYQVPWGMYKVVTYLKERYGNPTIILSENGMDDPGNLTLPEGLYDQIRVNYYRSYLKELKRAMDDGANVIGYFAWSLLDNFEWLLGYTSRFGLVYVDYNDLKRYPKLLAYWFKHMLERNNV